MVAIDEAVAGLLLVATFLVHLAFSPYTKVEESFNIQAIHDLQTYGFPSPFNGTIVSAKYDHVEFPGVVPRTFVGAIVISAITSVLGPNFNQSVAGGQFFARFVLGAINALAISGFRRALSKVYGRATANWYLLLQVSQFHLMYYLSRTLPNMLAFSLTTIALSNLVLAEYQLQDRQKLQRSALTWLTVAGIVFRSEIAVLLATQILYILATRSASITRTVIPAGFIGVIAGLLLTISIDSVFWQRFPIWPELAGFYFNTVQGKSADWGTSPLYYYFTHLLPRLILNPLALVLIPLCVLNPLTRPRVAVHLIPQFAFVAIYSFLPHKEWRFIIYIVPSLTAASAVGAAWIWNRRGKHILYRLLSLGLVGSILGSFVVSGAFLAISSINYPGGDALVRLHSIIGNKNTTAHVYADTLACQTGVTRFLEARLLRLPNDQPQLTIDKTENRTRLLEPLFWNQFDYVLTEDPKRVIGKWEIVDQVESFSNVWIVPRNLEKFPEINPPQWSDLRTWPEKWNYLGKEYRQSLTGSWWIMVNTVPRIYILKRDEREHFDP